MPHSFEGELQWSCLGCGGTGVLQVKVREIGSYTPSEWNHFHELCTGQHEARVPKDSGIKCQQPITWTVKATPASGLRRTACHHGGECAAERAHHEG